MELIIKLIISGGLLGVLGQGIRMVIGLKKLSNSNVTSNISGEVTTQFDGSRLSVSIFIGFLAGALALLIKSSLKDVNLDASIVTTIIAAGYSGADFIEGLFNTSALKFNPDLSQKRAEEQDNKKSALKNPVAQ